MNAKTPKNSTPKSSLDTHYNGMKSIVSIIVFGSILIILLWKISAPFIVKIIELSSLQELLNYIKWIGGAIALWATGYWFPTLPFLPRK
jgi:hypothetical protein